MNAIHSLDTVAMIAAVESMGRELPLGAPTRGIPFESIAEATAVVLMRKAADVSYWADNLC